MIWLLLLGLITYFIVQRVMTMTQTSGWLLWVGAITPTLILIGWAFAFREQRQIPARFLILLVFCYLGVYLYLSILQRGRISSHSPANPAPTKPLPKPDPIPESQSDPLAMRPIATTEEPNLRNCFTWDVFHLQSLEYRRQAIVCRGQLRAAPDLVYQRIRDNIATQFSDRFYVVLQESPSQQPFFELVPNPNRIVDSEVTLPRPWLHPRIIAVSLALLTLVSTTLAGLQITGRIVSVEGILSTGLPYALALMGFFAVRGIGCYLTAKRYAIDAVLPYFMPMIPLPFFPLGTLGAFTQIRSPIPHRKALFDLGMVGAFWGLSVSIPLLAWGLTQSRVVDFSARAGLFDFHQLNPRFSLALTLLAKLVFGADLVEQTSLQLHPIAIVGWLGLLFTAFNLMPIGQLDGGRMVHAMFGRHLGARIGQVARFLLLGFGLTRPYLLLWAVLLLLLPALDAPTLNDVSEVDASRDMIGLLALTLLILIVLPVPPLVMTWLGV